MQKNFVETGAAAEVAILLQEYDFGIQGHDQLSLTPFQKQVLLKYEEKKAQKKREQMPDTPGSGRTKNAASSSDNKIVNTTRYVNEGENNSEWEVID